MKRQTTLALVSMLACGAIGGWMLRTPAGGETPTARQPVKVESSADDADGADTPQAASDKAADNAADKGHDAEAAQLLAGADHFEALAWLNDATVSRGVPRWNKAEVVALIQGFYDTGAPRVWVVDTSKVGQTEVASQFVVQLPTEPAARKQVFDREGQFQAEYGDDPTPDTGQKYLLLTTD